MLSFRTLLVPCLLLIITLTATPLSALAAQAETEQYSEQNSPEAMTVDLVLVRPLGLVATLAGTLIFVVSLPFSALGGNTEEAMDSLVATPAKFTFQRPLGEFD